MKVNRIDSVSLNIVLSQSEYDLLFEMLCYSTLKHRFSMDDLMNSLVREAYK